MDHSPAVNVSKNEETRLGLRGAERKKGIEYRQSHISRWQLRPTSLCDTDGREDDVERRGSLLYLLVPTFSSNGDWIGYAFLLRWRFLVNTRATSHSLSLPILFLLTSKAD